MPASLHRGSLAAAASTAALAVLPAAVPAWAYPQPEVPEVMVFPARLVSPWGRRLVAPAVMGTPGVQTAAAAAAASASAPASAAAAAAASVGRRVRPRAASTVGTAARAASAAA